MADLRIVDAPEIPTENITGEEKLPTGGNGNYSISLDSLADYTKTKKDLVDNATVDSKVNGVKQELDTHIEDLLNPHQVTKGQIGLGNVDNTADLDKPVSNSTQATIISAVAPKADKTYVDNSLTSKSDKAYVDTQLALKANKSDVYTKAETYTKQESSDLVNNSISTALTPVNSSLDLAKRGIANRYDSSLTYNSGDRVVLTNGDIVKSNIDANTNNPNVDMTGWDFVGKTISSVQGLFLISPVRDGLEVRVTDPIRGGLFTYSKSRSAENNGVTVFNGWVRLQQNAEINVTWAGAIGDGVNDDTDAFNAAKDVAMKIGGGVYIPAPRDHYKITSTITFNEKIHFRGDGGTMIDSWHGKTSQGGSRIKFYGTGAAFHLNPLLSPTSEQRPAYGVLFKDLIIEGTELASHGIKVSDESLINVAGADIGSFNIDNVYLINFKHGRGLEINFCFMNTIRNMFTGDCAVGATLRYAHNTTFLGGSFQQGLLGLDASDSYDVNLHGTCLQGHHPDRAELLGMAMPSDFRVWTGGWDGAGADSVLRTTPADYAGIGCRVIGSVVSWFGGYEEYNEVGYVTELGSTLRLYGKYVDLDAMSKYWLQIGIGSLTVESPTFYQGQFPKLKGVIHTERNYAAPINITAPNFSALLPVAKQYTGRTTLNAGVIDQWNPNTFKFNRKLLNTDVDVHGVVQHRGSHCTGGFNKEFRELISPATTSSITLDMAVGTTGVNFLHLANGVNITLDFNDPNRAQSGVTMKIVLINNHATAATTIIFSNKFHTGSPSYVLDKQKQRVFEFYFENGAWLEVGVPLTL